MPVMAYKANTALKFKSTSSIQAHLPPSIHPIYFFTGC